MEIKFEMTRDHKFLKNLKSEEEIQSGILVLEMYFSIIGECVKSLNIMRKLLSEGVTTKAFEDISDDLEFFIMKSLRNLESNEVSFDLTFDVRDQE